MITDQKQTANTHLKTHWKLLMPPKNNTQKSKTIVSEFTSFSYIDQGETQFNKKILLKIKINAGI